MNCMWQLGFKLEMLWTGNLILYRVADNVGIWKSNTYGSKAYQGSMLSNGNFVLYDKNLTSTFWSSNTNGNEGAYLLVSDDGNLVIKNPTGNVIWTSNSTSNCTGKCASFIEVLYIKLCNLLAFPYIRRFNNIKKVS